MTSLVVDASVVAKWFLPEEDSDLALRILDHSGNNGYQLLAPDLLLSEFGNILWKRRDYLDEVTGQDIIRDLLAWDIAWIFSEQIIAAAYGLARKYNRTVYDSMYLALAESRNCELVTADERLYNAVARELPFVQWLRNWNPKETV